MSGIHFMKLLILQTLTISFSDLSSIWTLERCSYAWNRLLTSFYWLFLLNSLFILPASNHLPLGASSLYLCIRCAFLLCAKLFIWIFKNGILIFRNHFIHHLNWANFRTQQPLESCVHRTISNRVRTYRKFKVLEFDKFVSGNLNAKLIRACTHLLFSLLIYCVRLSKWWSWLIQFTYAKHKISFFAKQCQFVLV